MSKSKRNRRPSYANQRAAIRVDRNERANIGGVSYTTNREDDFTAAVYTDSKNASNFSVVVGQTSVSLTGRQARTIQRLLNKHFGSCGVPAWPGAFES